jgi:hypothetical protein
VFADLRRAYSASRIILASTSGEITDTEITEDRLTLVAVAMERTQVRFAALDIAGRSESFAAGCALAERLSQPGLVHVFVLSDGRRVNGSELARGFSRRLPSGATITGGLAGDGARFSKTLVGLDEPPADGKIVAIGFAGAHLRVGFGVSSGWVPFGPERTVTRAEDNTLYELDGQSALRLYKTYLGDQAALLPGAALRFPLRIAPADGGPAFVRTILEIDETAESMTFAGDIPRGARANFMRASYEDLIDGAGQAAERAVLDPAAELAICISCVGRRIVLGQRTEEETENVRSALGPGPILTGFYSYGELSPPASGKECQLHNETMTLTTLRED